VYEVPAQHPRATTSPRSIGTALTSTTPQVAARVEAAIRATVEMLAAHPEFGSKTDHRVAVRRWPMTEYPYTIF
jgi:plasmid stabilization system protein ParE